MKDERGEIATLLTIGTLVVIGVTAVVSSLFVNKPQTTGSRASTVCTNGTTPVTGNASLDTCYNLCAGKYDYQQWTEGAKRYCCCKPAGGGSTNTGCTTNQDCSKVSGGTYTGTFSIKGSYWYPSGDCSGTGSTGGWKAVCKQVPSGGGGATCTPTKCSTISNTYPNGSFYTKGTSTIYKDSSCSTEATEGVGNYCKSLNTTGGGGGDTSGCETRNCSEVIKTYTGNYWLKGGRYYKDNKCTMDITDFGVGNYCKGINTVPDPKVTPPCINASYMAIKDCEDACGTGQCRGCMYGSLGKYECLRDTSQLEACSSVHYPSLSTCNGSCNEGYSCKQCNFSNAVWYHCSKTGAEQCTGTATPCGTGCCDTSKNKCVNNKCIGTCDASDITTKYCSSYNCGNNDNRPYHNTSASYYYSAAFQKAYSDKTCQNTIDEFSTCCVQEGISQCANLSKQYCTGGICKDNGGGTGNGNKYYLLGSSSYYNENCQAVTSIKDYCGCGEDPRGSCALSSAVKSNCASYSCTQSGLKPRNQRDYYQIVNAYYDDGKPCQIIPNRDNYCDCGTPPPNDGSNYCHVQSIPVAPYSTCTGDCGNDLTAKCQSDSKGGCKCIGPNGEVPPVANQPYKYNISVTINGDLKNVDEVVLQYGDRAGSYGFGQRSVTTEGLTDTKRTLTMSGDYNTDVKDTTHCSVEARYHGKGIPPVGDFLCKSTPSSVVVSVGGGNGNSGDNGKPAENDNPAAGTPCTNCHTGNGGNGSLGESACFSDVKHQTRVDCSVTGIEKSEPCTLDGWSGTFRYKTICKPSPYECGYQAYSRTGNSWSSVYDIKSFGQVNRNSDDKCVIAGNSACTQTVIVMISNLNVFQNYSGSFTSGKICLLGGVNYADNICSAVPNPNLNTAMQTFTLTFASSTHYFKAGAYWIDSKSRVYSNEASIQSILCKPNESTYLVIDANKPNPK